MISIVMPAYRTPKMVAYSIYKLIKHSGPNVEIIVVNNYPQDGDTLRYLQPFIDRIKYVDYPEGRLQSHGIAVDYAIENGIVTGDYFMVLESDSFPTKDWELYYERIIDNDFDAAGSILKLSGGTYLHCNAAIYKTSVWYEVNDYIKTIEYKYFPNMAMKGGFASHLMVHNSILDKFLDNPEDYIELSDGYKSYSKEKALEKLSYYSPTVGVMHNGMGNIQEMVTTYGDRTFGLDVPNIILNNRQKLILRVGYEPSQSLSYMLHALNKKVFSIPTEVKWMPNREGQQQEYTLNEAGIYHCWGVSSYTERGSDGVEDIYEAKNNIPDELYNSIPENLKIKE